MLCLNRHSNTTPMAKLDLSQARTWTFFHFDTSDLANNLESAVKQDPKPLGSIKIVQEAERLFGGGGFLLLPDPDREPETALADLTPGNRDAIVEKILKDEKPDGFWGMLSFRENPGSQTEREKGYGTIDLGRNPFLESSITHTGRNKDFDPDKDAVIEEFEISADHPDFQRMLDSAELQIFTPGNHDLAQSLPEGITPEDEDIIVSVVDLEGPDDEVETFLFPESETDYLKSGVRYKIDHAEKNLFRFEEADRSIRPVRKRRFWFRVRRFFRGIGREIRKFVRESTGVLSEGIRIFLKPFLKNRYQLLKYEPDASTFKVVQNGAYNPEARTLLLIPGTLKGTLVGPRRNRQKGQGSFNVLLEDFEYGESVSPGANWVDAILEGPYEQVLAFDHETILDSVEDNLEELRKLLRQASGEIPVFTHPVSVVCTSRGHLIGKQLWKDAVLKNHLSIDRIATIACGHCGYLSSAEGVNQFLKILITGISGPMGPLISALASLPISTLLNLRGLKVQNSNSDSYRDILYALPEGTTESDLPRILPFAFDWGRNNIWEFLADRFLGDKNDTVIGYEAQQDPMPGRLPQAFEGPVTGIAKHGKALKQLHIRSVLYDYLTMPDPDQVT